MKLVFENVTEVNYLGKRIYEKKDDHGVVTDLTYYVSVDSNDGFGSFPCSIELFNSIGDLPKYTPINFAMVYDSFDRSFKVVKLVPVKNN